MPYLLQNLLEISVQQNPDRKAVIYKNQSITYGELETISNQLAYVLRNAGINKGDRVGIYLNKSIETVIAIFGILKTGAVYVPLDSSSPAKRVALIISDCSIKALISSQKKIATLDPTWLNQSPVQCLILAEHTKSLGNLELSWQKVLEAPSNSLSTDLTGDELAYILYTSGSTGQPKGVMISHRASLNFVNWGYDCFEVGATDRVSNHAPFHFDLSVFDLFTTIKAGATVILVPPGLSVFPLNLARFIAEQKITIWYSVPSVLVQLLLQGNLDKYQFPHLRHILFAGEVFPLKYLRQLRNLLPHVNFHNLYGPTETNVCTYYPVNEIPLGELESLPIGRACAKHELFAINEQGEIAKPGEVGELYVRGPSLMKGYWGMAEKSQEVLVPDPRYAVNQGTVYRTGDLVKQAADGNYLFLGRRDNLIKSRGYRIDMGEVETVLYQHPVVREVAVIPIPDDRVGNLLKAVVVKQEDSQLNQSDLEYFCSQYLPKYMIPNQLEFRDCLPKTSTGKVDRKLLRQEFVEDEKNS